MSARGRAVGRTGPVPRIQARSVLLHVIVGLASLLVIFPFIWMILGAFKPAAELRRPVPTWWPESAGFESFTALFSSFSFDRYFINSVFVTLTAVGLILFSSSLLGYVFGRGGFRGENALFLMFISAMIIPFEVMVVPLFLVISDLGWVDSYQALIVPFVIDAFGIYLFRETMAGIPRDYFDAARIDGASQWTCYRRIALPQCKPIIATLGIFSFVYIWDQLIWPIVAISSNAKRTLPVGISLLSTESGARIDLVLAAGVISVLPPLIVFLIFQRRIIKGAMMSGLKG